MQKPKIKPTVKLIGNSGNSFFIIGTINKALRKHGADKEYIDQFIKEATSGNYDNVLRTAMKYVDVK